MSVSVRGFGKTRRSLVGSKYLAAALSLAFDRMTGGAAEIFVQGFHLFRRCDSQHA